MPDYQSRMDAIVEEKLVAYHSDLDLDRNMIQIHGPGRYLWAVRSTGTDIVKIEQPQNQASLWHLRWFIGAANNNEDFYLIDTEKDTVRRTTRDAAVNKLKALDPGAPLTVDIWTGEGATDAV